MRRIWKEEWKTYGNVFSNYTNRNLFKLSSQGHFSELKSPIAIGKEANVFSASSEKCPVIVKIYRLENADFNKMYDYIRQDERYINIRRNKRHIIFSWAQREFRNLMIAREASVRVPLPIAIKDTIIVMEQIGEPAPRLKDYQLNDPHGFLDILIGQMGKMWKAGLVHGDLSQFNILVENERPVLIDFSQGSTTRSQNAKELLVRDIYNVINYFSKLGVKKDKDETYAEIMK